jgi:hypothetical protein
MGKNLDATNTNHSSSTCAISFTQTNPCTSGPLAGDTSLSNLFVQLVNHFHSRTTIEGSAHTLGMPQQTTINMFSQGYTHTQYRALLYPTLIQPHIPLGIMFRYILTLTTITQLRTLPYLTPTPSHYRVVCWVSYPTTPSKTRHVSTPTASQKPLALVLKPHRNFPLDHSQLI